MVQSLTLIVDPNILSSSFLLNVLPKSTNLFILAKEAMCQYVSNQNIKLNETSNVLVISTKGSIMDVATIHEEYCYISKLIN